MSHTSTRRRAACAIPAIVLAAVLGSCSDSTNPDTKYLGEYHVQAHLIDMADTISSDDTLTVYIDGSTDPSGSLYDVRFDAVRESHGLELTVWADVYEWIGSGPPPPCGVAWGEYKAAPPFPAGIFRVIVDQPDSSIMADSVYVRS